MKEIIGLITVSLSIAAYAPYIRDLLRHKVQPHPYSWFIWGLTATIMFGLQVLNGGGAMSWSTLTVGIISFFICGLAWKAGGKRLITWHDQIALGAAFVALVLWLLADEPTLSMLLLVATDLFGFIPSVRKTWHRPYSETLTMWTINIARHGLNIFAISTYSLLTLADPVIWTLANFGFVAMVIIRRMMVRTLAPSAATE